MTAARYRALTTGASLLFLAYAGCFLYFFVDDEAIPLVYAHNLLRGRGLIYTVLEGRVEGYSDFLHVLWSTVLLTITRAFSWSRLLPLLIGKAVSLVAGVLVVVLTARALTAMRVRAPAASAGLVFVALAGPLAVWSASSLETAVFTLTLLAFAGALWQERLSTAVVLGILLALERIDGPIYIGIALAAALAGFPRRWRFLLQVGALVAAAVIAYQAWRLVYFGSLLSTPMAAKVLHRIASPPRALVKAPTIAYLEGLIGIYGWTGVAALIAAAALAVRNEVGRLALAIIVLIGLYAERVDDWMFGWRFAVAMVPFVAVVLAVAVDRLPRRASAVAATAVAVWSGIAAMTFARQYQENESRPIFWLHPRGGEEAWLGRYAELLAVGRELMHAGDRVAYNQAGLLAYVLELENIDDLGICSRFEARLPTTDVYYTGVGRYSPINNTPVIRTAHAYLLYQNVRFLVSPVDLLLKANHGRIPDRVLDDAFARVHDPRLRENVLYRRTDKPMERFGRDPIAFTENVAHYSHVIAAAIDGHPLADAEIGPRMPFVRELGWAQDYGGSLSIDLTFAKTPVDVTELYLEGASSSSPATLAITLGDGSRRAVYRSELPVGPTERPVLLSLPAGTRAVSLSLALHATERARATLTDLRLQGQTPELAAFVRRTLRFPSPEW